MFRLRFTTVVEAPLTVAFDVARTLGPAVGYPAGGGRLGAAGARRLRRRTRAAAGGGSPIRGGSRPPARARRSTSRSTGRRRCPGVLGGVRRPGGAAPTDRSGRCRATSTRTRRPRRGRRSTSSRWSARRSSTATGCSSPSARAAPTTAAGSSRAARSSRGSPTCRRWCARSGRSSARPSCRRRSSARSCWTASSAAGRRAPSTLRVWWARISGGAPVAHEHAALRWLRADELDDLDWIAADRPLLPAVRALLSRPLTPLLGTFGAESPESLPDFRRRKSRDDGAEPVDDGRVAGRDCCPRQAGPMPCVASGPSRRLSRISCGRRGCGHGRSSSSPGRLPALLRNVYADPALTADHQLYARAAALLMPPGRCSVAGRRPRRLGAPFALPVDPVTGAGCRTECSLARTREACGSTVRPSDRADVTTVDRRCVRPTAPAADGVGRCRAGTHVPTAVARPRRNGACGASGRRGRCRHVHARRAWVAGERRRVRQGAFHSSTGAARVHPSHGCGSPAHWAGLPAPVPQFDVLDGGEFLGPRGSRLARGSG